METTIEVIKAILSWPMVCIIVIIILHKPIRKLIERLISSQEGEAKVGPIVIKLGKLAEDGREAVDTLKSINTVMAESRLLELEITDGMFGDIFSDKQQTQMKKHIEELKLLTK